MYILLLCIILAFLNMLNFTRNLNTLLLSIYLNKIYLGYFNMSFIQYLNIQIKYWNNLITYKNIQYL